MLDQGTLVLECVTLAQLVQLVVEVLVNLAGSTILDKKTSENTKASHP
jgi:NAD dependent epimerase/dehydratase family enzyme